MAVDMIPTFMAAHLPNEIIQHILSDFWASPLTREERALAFQSLTMVDYTWLSIFLRVALTDVHILSPAFGEKYIHIVHTRSGFEQDVEYLQPGLSGLANTLCRSMTFYVRSNSAATHSGENVHHSSESGRSALPAAEQHWGGTIDITLSMLGILRAVPNLRSVSMAYHNVQFNDILGCGRLLDMPSQVTSLEIKFSYSQNLMCLRSKSSQPNPRPRRIWTLPNIEKLRIWGAPATLISDMLETCPNTDTLEVGDVVGHKHIAVPHAVKLFVFHYAPDQFTCMLHSTKSH